MAAAATAFFFCPRSKQSEQFIVFWPLLLVSVESAVVLRPDSRSWHLDTPVASRLCVCQTGWQPAHLDSGYAKSSPLNKGFMCISAFSPCYPRHVLQICIHSR